MSLKEQWVKAAGSRMAPKEQCKLWVLREILQLHGEVTDQYDWMSSKVVLGNGKHPSRNSVRTFFKRVDEASWQPRIKRSAL